MQKKDIIKQTLSDHNFLKVYTPFPKILGFSSGILLSYLIDKDDYITAKEANANETIIEFRLQTDKDFFHCNTNKLTEKLPLNSDSISRNFNNLKKLGYVEIKLTGVPRRRFVKIDYEKVEQLLQDWRTKSRNKYIDNQDTVVLPNTEHIYNNQTNNQNKVLLHNTIQDSKKNPSKDINPSNSLLEDPSKSEIPIPIQSILKSLIEIGGFKHKLPKDNKPPTKVIQQTIKYLKMIKSGTFTREVKLPKTWQDKYIEKYPSIKGYEKWSDVRKLVLDSITNMAIDKKENNKAGGNLWFPRNVNQFFFNSSNKNNKNDLSTEGKSMFLKYMNITPKASEDITAEWQKNKLPEPLPEYLQEVLDYHKGYDGEGFWENDKLQFWSNMNQLYTWYKKNCERLREYNRTYHDNGWGYHCGEPHGFFRYVAQYLKEEVGRLVPRPFPRMDMQSQYWRNFRAWLLNGFNIEIEIDLGKEENAGTVIAQRQKENHDMKIANEIDKIVAECSEINIEVPEYDELVKHAERRIYEKEHPEEFEDEDA